VVINLVADFLPATQYDTFKWWSEKVEKERRGEKEGE